MKTNTHIILEIEDYVGGNIEGIEEPDRMSFTRFLRSILEQKDQEIVVTEKLLCDRSDVLKMIPECKEHGFCLPHCENWIGIQKDKLKK